MRRLAFVLTILGCATTGMAADGPVVLELFTSEGCSSCPPADRLLQELDQKQATNGGGTALIVLSEHVDYFNSLGWKDPYSSSEFTARQELYTRKYGFDGVYTSQLVVDGRFGFVGSDARKAEMAIQQAAREPKVELRIVGAARSGNWVTATLDLPPAAGGRNEELYVALADERIESHISNGENAGRVLSHVAVARELRRLGRINVRTGDTREVKLAILPGAGIRGLRLIAFVQDSATGRIIGAAQQKL